MRAGRREEMASLVVVAVVGAGELGSPVSVPHPFARQHPSPPTSDVPRMVFLVG